MAKVTYFRCSTTGQSLEAQRQALGGSYDREFHDFGVSGATAAAQRPGFASMLDYVRDGDEVHVSSLDRIGRDALDVQATVRALLARGVRLEVLGIGPIARGVGEIVIAVLAQIADIERHRIKERCDNGRAAARASLIANGKTHRGKASLGRPVAADASTVQEWRKANRASIAQTAAHFGVGQSTVKRYCATV